MPENFQEVISEDIHNLIEKKGCYFCHEKVEYRTLGGFKTEEDNSLDIQNPICKPCWLKKDWQEQEGFLSLGNVLKEAKGDLTDTVKIEWPEAVPVSENECIATETPWEVKMNQCDHTYKPAEDNLLRCQKCSKEVSIMGS